MQSAPDTPSSHCGRCGAPLCGAPLRPQDVRGFKQGCRHFPSPGGRRTHPPGITRENATLRYMSARSTKLHMRAHRKPYWKNSRFVVAAVSGCNNPNLKQGI